MCQARACSCWPSLAVAQLGRSYVGLADAAQTRSSLLRQQALLATDESTRALNMVASPPVQNLARVSCTLSMLKRSECVKLDGRDWCMCSGRGLWAACLTSAPHLSRMVLHEQPIFSILSVLLQPLQGGPCCMGFSCLCTEEPHSVCDLFLLTHSCCLLLVLC